MSTRKPQRTLNAQIRNEAAEWLLRFSEEEVDATGREEFNDWLRTSPEHLRAYLRATAFWQEAGEIDGGKGPRDIAALVAQAQKDANVFPLALGSHTAEPEAGQRTSFAATPAQGARSVLSRGLKFAAVAAALVMVVGGLGVYQHLTQNIYQTRVGEQRTVNLPDGSTVILNADSRLKVRYSRTERIIDLDAGQAMFKVARNATRPFIVRSGDARVRAVGTEFDVYRKRTGTTVTVVEGKVATTHAELQPIFLEAGEQLMIPAFVPPAADTRAAPARSLREMRVHPVKIEEATAWTAGLLVFDGAPLAEVIQEFNRQNTKPIVLERDADFSQLRISGTFPASGAQRITKFLQERFGVIVNETDDDIRLSR